MHGDDFRDGTYGSGERFVGVLEGIDDAQVVVDIAETLVVDDEEGIDFLGEQVKAVESLVDLLLAFEKEGDGHDTDREDAFLLGFVGDDR